MINKLKTAFPTLVLTNEDIDALRAESKDKFMRPTQPRIIVTIPCYNEEHFIDEVVRKAKEYVDDAIVIDDGYCDCTSQVARTAGAHLVAHGHNKDAGAAVRPCLEHPEKEALTQ